MLNFFCVDTSRKIKSLLIFLEIHTINDKTRAHYRYLTRTRSALFAFLCLFSGRARAADRISQKAHAANWRSLSARTSPLSSPPPPWPPWWSTACSTTSRSTRMLAFSGAQKLDEQTDVSTGIKILHNPRVSSVWCARDNSLPLLVC